MRNTGLSASTPFSQTLTISHLWSSRRVAVPSFSSRRRTTSLKPPQATRGGCSTKRHPVFLSKYQISRRSQTSTIKISRPSHIKAYTSQVRKWANWTWFSRNLLMMEVILSQFNLVLIHALANPAECQKAHYQTYPRRPNNQPDR